ncbi:MAG: drug/metabolite transporter (DMT)-like permease [Glaciecola sp.]
MQRQYSTSTVIAGLATGVIAVGYSAIAVRYAIEGGAGPVAVAFWRSFVGALILAPAAARSRRKSAPLSRERQRQIVAAGVFLGLHFALWLSSLEYTTVASSVTLVTMSPIFVALLARRVLGETVSRRAWIGMGITIAGALAIGLADGAAVDLGRRALFGDLLAFLGALAVAGYMVMGRSVRRDVSVSTYASGAYGVAAAILLPAALILDQALWGYQAQAWWAILAIIIGPQLLGHTIFNTLLSTVSATTVAIVVLSEPVLSTLLAWLLLTELPAPLFWVGAPIVLIGVTIASTGQRRRSADEEPVAQLRSESVGTP